MEQNAPPTYLRLTQIVEVQELIPPKEAAAPAGKPKKGKAKKPASSAPPAPKFRKVQKELSAYILCGGAPCEISAIEPWPSGNGRYYRDKEEHRPSTLVSAAGVSGNHDHELGVEETPDQVFALLERAVGARAVTREDLIVRLSDYTPAKVSNGVREIDPAPTDEEGHELPPLREGAIVAVDLPTKKLRVRFSDGSHEWLPASAFIALRPPEQAQTTPDPEAAENIASAPAPASEAQDDAAPFLLACDVDCRDLIAADVFFAGDDGLTAQGVLVEIGKHEGEPILRIGSPSAKKIVSNGAVAHTAFIARRPRDVFSTFEAAESALAPKRPLRPVHLADGSNALVGARVFIVSDGGVIDVGDRGVIDEATITSISPRRTYPIMLEGVHPEDAPAPWVQEVSGAEVYPTRDAALAAAGGSPAEPSAVIPLPGQDEEDEEEAPDSTPIDSGVDGRTVSIPDAVCADDPALARDRMTDDGAPLAPAPAAEPALATA